MDLSSAGVTYILLLLPTVISLAVIAQGVTKISHKEHDGHGVLAFGIVFLMLIGAAYWFFIR
jgi:hypothetical protein